MLKLHYSPLMRSRKNELSIFQSWFLERLQMLRDEHFPDRPWKLFYCPSPIFPCSASDLIARLAPINYSLIYNVYPTKPNFILRHIPMQGYPMRLENMSRLQSK